MSWDNEPLYLHKGKFFSPVPAYHFMPDRVEMIVGCCWIPITVYCGLLGYRASVHSTPAAYWSPSLSPWWGFKLVTLTIIGHVTKLSNLFGPFALLNWLIRLLLCRLKVDTLFFSISLIIIIIIIIIIIEVFRYYPDKGIIIKKMIITIPNHFRAFDSSC